MGTGNILLGGNPAMDWHPIQGEVAVLSVALSYRNRDNLRLCGLPWPVCDFTYHLSLLYWTSCHSLRPLHPWQKYSLTRMLLL